MLKALPGGLHSAEDDSAVFPICLQVPETPVEALKCNSTPSGIVTESSSRRSNERIAKKGTINNELNVLGTVKPTIQCSLMAAQQIEAQRIEAQRIPKNRMIFEFKFNERSPFHL